MNTSNNSRPRRWRVTACGAATALMMLLTACSATTEPSNGDASPHKDPANTATASADQMRDVLKRSMNPDVDPSTLAPEIQTVLASAATPLTAEQQATWERCLSKSTCDLGAGNKVLGVLDDLANPSNNIQWGEVLAQAIQSGEVKTIIHTNANGNLTEFQANFRQLITRKVDAIVGMMPVFGSQAGPLVAQAKAAGIPVVNGAVEMPKNVAADLGVEISAPVCDMFKQAAPA